MFVHKVPTSLMAIETNNNIIGYTTNAHNRLLSSGGSSGGRILQWFLIAHECSKLIHDSRRGSTASAERQPSRARVRRW